MTGCSDLGAPLKLLPHIELSPTTVDFGTVLVSGSATRTVLVGNSGNGALSGFAAVACPGYSIDSGGGAFTVAPAGQHSIVVRYQPSVSGSSPCVLTLGDGLPSVPLSGNASLQAAGAVCAVSTGALDFGTIGVGGSTPGAFKVFSTGSAAVNLDVVASCSDFTVVNGGGPRTLAPGDSLSVTLRFAPTAGGHRACTIATGPGCPDVAVTGDATSVSYASQIQPIFRNRNCIFCHALNSPADVVNVRSIYSPPNVLVKPFDAVNSVLYGRVTGSRFGTRMPLGGSPLPTSETDLIKTWILEGAHDN
jgi:hypothetical protein